VKNELDQHLKILKLKFFSDNYRQAAKTAADKLWPHVDYLAELANGEVGLRKDRAVTRRIRAARFAVIKTMDQFQWQWPQKINRLKVQNLLTLNFIKDKTNIVFLGGVGLGKTHLATAIGYSACLAGINTLFTSAIDVINTLSAAQANHRLKTELQKYIKPSLLIVDELGYLPIDKTGADLLFQIFSCRYEQGATVITSNRAYKDWTQIFNNDATLTSALLDRLLHHAETIVIEGKSFRMKEQIQP
jgi:DNA replication protein DnaC